MCVCYAREFGSVTNDVSFVLVSILVGFARVLLELQILLVHGSWPKEVCLAILMFLYMFFMYNSFGN
jgi:hypothetical protein